MHDHLIEGRPVVSRACRAAALRRALVAVLLCTTALAWLRPRRVVVEGPSMLPTLEPGDRLLLVRLGRPRVGDLVGVPDPRDPRRLLVKRVAADRDGLLELAGDNAGASTDSRVFGPVPRRAVRGTVVRRYAPARRAGPVG